MFLLNSKQYFDEKFLQLKSSLSIIISENLSNLKPTSSTNKNYTVDETLRLLKIKNPRINIAQLDDILCWMIDNTTDYSKFPVIVSKTNGNIDVNETWKSINSWIDHLNEEKSRVLMEVAAAEEKLKQAEKDAAIKKAEEEAAAKKAAADAALSAAAKAAQQAQEALEAAEKLKL